MPAANEPLEFVLLANGAKGAAAINLVKQAIDHPSVYVFGEILDHPNIVDLETSHPEGPTYLSLLRIFAYGTYADYLAAAAASNEGQKDNSSGLLPPLSDNGVKKLRLLTIASLATKSKTIKYSDLMKELRIESGNVRELEDLIIEGSNDNVIRGKLDQRSSHFEVDFALGRDIQKSDIKRIKDTLQGWCDSCDGMLACLEHQVNRANTLKSNHIAHKKVIEDKVKDIRNQLKAQQQLSEGPEDPDSRMETDRERRGDAPRKAGAGKIKGLRGQKPGFPWPK